MQFNHWIHFFNSNAGHFHHFRFTDDHAIDEVERRIIERSLQQFQHGEQSEGKNLFRYAKGFDSDGYLKAIVPFIREEQDHAMILGKFMERNGIERIKGHWVNEVFRGLRRFAGLEMSITVLLTAETIAAVYYKALGRATSSVDLQRICADILRDEEMHINFQSYTINLLQRDRSWLHRKCLRYAHQFLMAGTIAVVYVGHGRVLRAGGYTAWQFAREVQREFMRADAMILGQRSMATVH